MTKEHLERNTTSPWVHVADRMPENSFPELTKPERGRTEIKVMVLLLNNNVMQAVRRKSAVGIWYFNIPLRMREQITHWMPIPPIPNHFN